MAKPIYVADMDNERSIVYAFQKAMDRVFSPAAMRRLLQHYGPLTEYVYGMAGQPAIGHASCVVGNDGNLLGYSSLFLAVYTEGHYREDAVRYVPRGVASRFVIKLRGTHLGASVEHVRRDRECRAHLHTTTATLQAHPKAIVSVRGV